MANWNRWWPDTSDLPTAEKAIEQACQVAFAIASITAIIALVAIYLHKPIAGFDGGALVDAAIFATIGFGIYRKSRAAAVVGLIVYIAERIYGFTQRPGNAASGVAMSIVFTLAFMHGVRGTFAYRKLAVKMKKCPECERFVEEKDQACLCGREFQTPTIVNGIVVQE